MIPPDPVKSVGPLIALQQLVLLAVVLEQQTELKPTQIMTTPARIAMSCSACSDSSAIDSARA
jgi:hypothetical protein